MVWGKIKFLPTSVEEKNLVLGRELSLPTSAKGKYYIWS